MKLLQTKWTLIIFLKSCRRQLLPALLLSLSILSVCCPAYSQSFTSGYKLYTKGDFQAAIEAFERTLLRQQTLSSQEKARVFKYLGICHFMLKKRANARQFFRAALQESPEITIIANEVLDEEILSFFDSIRTSMLVQQTDNRSNLTSQSETGTFMIIKTKNIKGDLVVGNRVIGTTNTKIPIKPGVIEIEIRSNEYRNQSFRLPIKRNRTNIFDLSLNRPKDSTANRTRRDGKRARIVLPNDKVNTRELSQVNRKSDRRKQKGQQRNRPQSQIPVPMYDQAAAQDSATSTSATLPPNTSNASGFRYYHVLPFGIGQFGNQDPLNGALFALGQATFLGLYIQSYVEEQEAFDSATQQIQQANASGSLPASEIEAFRKQSDRYIQQLQQDQLMYLSGFGVLWIGGIVDDISTAPKASTLCMSIQPGNLKLSYQFNSRHKYHFDWSPLDQTLTLSMEQRL